MIEIAIDSPWNKAEAIKQIYAITTDGSMVVKIQKVDKSVTAKQRGLWWKWMKDVSESGKGQDDTKEAIHIRAKWQFGRPVLLRDDDLFGIIYHQFMGYVQGTPGFAECCRAFSEQYISTERMTRKQRAEMMTDFQRFWTGHGVNLTDPDDFGKDLLKYS